MDINIINRCYHCGKHSNISTNGLCIECDYEFVNQNKGIINFYLGYLDKLYENKIIRERILSYNLYEYKFLNEKDLFKQILIHYLEEAELTLSLFKNIFISNKIKLLEIGSGLGFAYGYIKKKGYEITGLEPDLSNYTVAIELFKIIGIDSSTFHSIKAEEIYLLTEEFDLIFSNNVLEHIKDLNKALFELKNRLKHNGIMVHSTVNYLIPYEPHLKILLFPFFPKITRLFKPKLKESALWKELNFITTINLKKICKKHHLKILFQKDMLYETFLRFDKHEEFAKRQKIFYSLFKFLKITKLLKFLKFIPINITTPVKFIIKKND